MGRWYCWIPNALFMYIKILYVIDVLDRFKKTTKTQCCVSWILHGWGQFNGCQLGNVLALIICCFLHIKPIGSLWRQLGLFRDQTNKIYSPNKHLYLVSKCHGLLLLFLFLFDILVQYLKIFSNEDLIKLIYAWYSLKRCNEHFLYFFHCRKLVYAFQCWKM